MGGIGVPGGRGTGGRSIMSTGIEGGFDRERRTSVGYQCIIGLSI